MPATFSQAGAVEMPSGNVLVAAKGGHGSGSGSGSGSKTSGGSVSNSPGSGPGSSDSRSNASPASGKHNPSQDQTQTTERLETRQSAPDKVNGRQANRVMENALGTLKQIREQTMDQARMGEKWQELRGQINQIKEQRKLRQVTGEEAKIMLRNCLELAKERQNLEEQENLLKDLIIT
ncbi:hypothetical protein [Desulforamulus profundi]|nr:hypothetical protein [Desulforamulus profundi]